jgi:hypothetical protein
MKRLVLWLLFMIAPWAAQADGGVVRARETQGPFVITVFSPPTITLSAPADLSVLVQHKDTGTAVLDATVELAFTAPSGSSLPVEGGWCGPMKDTFLLGASALGRSPAVPATHARATNKLLYAAQVILPARGEWHMQVAVRHHGETSMLSCNLPIVEPTAQWAILWPWLVFPPIAVALFVLHQRLRYRPRPGMEVRGYLA